MTKTILMVLGSLGSLLVATGARAADVNTADVLKKLHESNQKEIEMGKLAEQKGQSKEVKSFGKMLVKDHTAADKKVTALAKEQKTELAPAPTQAMDHMGSMGSGPEFDAKFAQEMLDDHKKDIAEVKQARDGTADAKLKKLIDDLLPTLQKHEDTAQKIVDGHNKSASR